MLNEVTQHQLSPLAGNTDMLHLLKPSGREMAGITPSKFEVHHVTG